MSTSTSIVRIEIASVSVRTLKGKSQKTGNDYEMRMQEAYFHNGHAYPERFEVPVPKTDRGEFLEPYAPGFYTLSPGSIQVNRQYGRLEISAFDMQLLALPATPAADATSESQKPVQAESGAGKGKADKPF